MKKIELTLDDEVCSFCVYFFQVAKAKFFRASEKEREEREREEKERSRKRKLELANITYVDTSEAANKRRKIEEAKVVDASLCDAQILIQGGGLFQFSEPQTKVRSTNTQSRFASVVLDGVLGTPTLAQYT